MSKINPKQMFINKFKLVNAGRYEEFTEEELERINSTNVNTLETTVESQVGNVVSLYVEDEGLKIKGDGQAYTKLSLTGDHSKYFTSITPVAQDPATVLDILPPGVYADNRNSGNITSWILGEDVEEVKTILKNNFKVDIANNEINTSAIDATKGTVTVTNQYMSFTIPYYIAEFFDGMILEVTGIS